MKRGYAMRSAKEVANEINISLTEDQEKYLDRYMRLVRQKRVWVEDEERSSRIDEIEHALEVFMKMPRETRFAFEREALKEKYGC